MQFSSLTAISPIDGRYHDIINILRPIFSEYGLMRYRIIIEIRWLQTLSNCIEVKEIKEFTHEINNYLEDIILRFNIKHANQIKKIEQKINHDVKAIEYFLKKQIMHIPELKKIKEFVHFACTSEDINNLAYALMLKTTRDTIIIPQWKNIINILKQLAFKYKKLPLLARTHGQPATPTTVGKEFANIVYRMGRQLEQLNNIDILGKFNGTVGNYNAHLSAYPNILWEKMSKNFVTSLGITWNPLTTQIEPHDYIAELLNCIARFNTILINFNRDLWGYIALNYFKINSINNEIGSSIMPYKVNPINFENSEGNLGLANAILNYCANTLPISRWQRDLTNSTLLRNLGTGISYALIGYQTFLIGFKKIEINEQSLLNALNSHWEIITEAIQTVMRKYNIYKPYEKLKNFTNNRNISKQDIIDFINQLKLPEYEKNMLKNITPENYIGCADKIIDIL
uniref:Adenylosuccinate lyase n=1 Tax=Candidatus Aschnera chinzeii TaxID=1485666 RepID=A0AAT9G516_9ENTR|nr:MAG: adenylosuccinate lyase [Candidatus Aschnera chinzeii]